MLTDSDDGDKLRSLVDLELKRKAEDQKSWPSKTEVKRLVSVFDALQKQGIIARHQAGWDKSEAFHDCLEMYQLLGSPAENFGLCYYTVQDVEAAVDGHPLHIGFSSSRPENEASDALKTGKLVFEELKRAGLDATWSGSVESRIAIQIKWQLKTRRPWWKFWDDFIKKAAAEQ